MIVFWPERLRDFFLGQRDHLIFCLALEVAFLFGLRGCVIFVGPRGCVIFFWPERLSDFFWPKRLHDFFLGPRGWVI